MWWIIWITLRFIESSPILFKWILRWWTCWGSCKLIRFATLSIELVAECLLLFFCHSLRDRVKLCRILRTENLWVPHELSFVDWCYLNIFTDTKMICRFLETLDISLLFLGCVNSRIWLWRLINISIHCLVLEIVHLFLDVLREVKVLIRDSNLLLTFQTLELNTNWLQSFYLTPEHFC